MGIIADFERRLKEPSREIFTGVIYKYTNLINSKCYVGQTTNEVSRRNKFKCGTSYSGVKFDNARKKYGTSDNWNYEVISRKNYLNEEDATFDLDLLEVYYISKYNSYKDGYNCTVGGEGAKGVIMSEEHKKKLSEALSGENNPFYGKHHTEETKRKLSEAKIGKMIGENNPMFGKTHTEESRKKIREAKIGKHLSEATKRKLSEALSGENGPFYGKHHTEEAKRKNREAHIGKTHTEETLKKLSEALSGENNPMFGKQRSVEVRKKISEKHSIPIIQLNKNNEIIREWKSAKEAAIELNIHSSNIAKCCKGKQKTAGGYIWKYVE